MLHQRLPPVFAPRVRNMSCRCTTHSRTKHQPVDRQTPGPVMCSVRMAAAPRSISHAHSQQDLIAYVCLWIIGVAVRSAGRWVSDSLTP